jgi:hypothetical protein
MRAAASYYILWIAATSLVWYSSTSGYQEADVVYQYESYRVQAAYAQTQTHQTRAQFRAVGAALRLYQRARTGALWTRICSSLRRKSHKLLPLSRIEASGRVRGRHFLGVHCVPIERIRGSGGRSGDFDASFRPLQTHSRGRWVTLAVAMQSGVVLPPVTLVQVQDQYFVLDGHHRISVARALGQKEVDAEVTVWDLVNPPPNLHLAAARRSVRQPT